MFRYLLDDLGHVLRALVLQPGQLEQLCNPPDADDVVLVEDLCQGPAAEALEAGQQVHVCHTQHVVGVLWGQLAVHRGELLPSPEHTAGHWQTNVLFGPLLDKYQPRRDRSSVFQATSPTQSPQRN